MNAALITARAGSKSIPSKNIIEVRGKPLLAYNIEAAKQAGLINRVYVSTDGEEIAHVSMEHGAEIIWRPSHLSGDESPHYECIEHGVNEILQQNPDLENMVVLLGNTVMVAGRDIDACLQMLDADTGLSGVLTVWKAQDDHPYRALTDDGSGFLKSFLGSDPTLSSNRQSYPTVYYYDQGVWAFRYKWAFRREGPSPWVWMGPRCGYIERPWVAGRDIHGSLDLEIAEWWIGK